MAGAGYKLFNVGDVLTAAQVNTYLQEQTVMSFADAAARTSALSAVLSEGMMSYLRDTNAVQVYNGSAWVAVGGSSPLTTKGDLYGFSTVDARVPIGTNNQVLTADSTQALGLKWATPAAAGGKTLLSTTALSGTTTTVSGISGSYTDLYVYVLAYPSVSATVSINFNSFAGWLGYYVRGGNSGTPGVSDTNSASNLNSINTFDNSAGGAIDAFVPQYATSGAGKYKMAQYNFLNSNGTTLSGVAWASSGSPTAAITGVTVSSTQTLTGTILVYGIS